MLAQPPRYPQHLPSIDPVIERRLLRDQLTAEYVDASLRNELVCPGKGDMSRCKQASGLCPKG